MTAIGRRLAAACGLDAEDRDVAALVTLLGRAAAGLAGAVGALGVLGWLSEIALLREIVPGSAPIRLLTSVSLVLLALGWFVPRPIGLAATALAGLLGAFTLAEYAVGASSAVDRWAARGDTGTQAGRMAVATALTMVLLAASWLLREFGRAVEAQVAATAVLALQFVTLLAHLYSASFLRTLRPLPTGTSSAAFALLLLAVAALATVPGGAVHWLLESMRPGAVLARRLLPVAALGLPIVGGLALLGERSSWWQGTTTVALVVLAGSLGVGVVGWAAARELNAADRGRTRAIEELTDLKGDLERQVQERAEQLQYRQAEIAVLEDRQRIAADLHDIVIQRLFAAGMSLQPGGVEPADPDVAARLANAVEAMDAAIKDLRTSIFELGRSGRLPRELADAVDDICRESARALGCRPEVVIDDGDGVPEDVREHLLAVLREALANVARHAHASRVHVVLRVAGGTASLTVADDGRGMGAAEHRSGTRNMVKRARDLGGDCVWQPVEPHGTRLHWQVPVATD